MGMLTSTKGSCIPLALSAMSVTCFSHSDFEHRVGAARGLSDQWIALLGDVRGPNARYRGTSCATLARVSTHAPGER